MPYCRECAGMRMLRSCNWVDGCECRVAWDGAVLTLRGDDGWMMDGGEPIGRRVWRGQVR
jgi:hypothetical protein